MPTSAPPNLDPDDWQAFRAASRRALDDMIDFLQTVRERPVWQPAPAEVARQFHQPLPRGPARPRRGARRLFHADPALCDRQPASAVHGLGARRRHAGRHDRRDAGRRPQRQLRRPQSHRARRRAPDRRLGGASCSAFPPTPPACSSPARRPPITSRCWSPAMRRSATSVRRRRPARRRTAARRLHLRRGAWLHQAGDGDGRHRLALPAPDPGRRSAARCAPICSPRRSPPTAPAGCGRSWSSAPPAPSTPAPSTISTRSPRSAAAKSSGSTSTAPSGRWRRCRQQPAAARPRHRARRFDRLRLPQMGACAL